MKVSETLQILKNRVLGKENKLSSYAPLSFKIREILLNETMNPNLT